MNLLTLLVLTPLICAVGLAFSVKVLKDGWDKEEETAKGLMALAAAIISLLGLLGSASTLLDLAPTLIKQEHVATQVIRVLDEHGWDKACEHIDCQALVDRVGERE